MKLPAGVRVTVSMAVEATSTVLASVLACPDSFKRFPLTTFARALELGLDASDTIDLSSCGAEKDMAWADRGRSQELLLILLFKGGQLNEYSN